MSALGSPQAMRMESAHAEPDWEEGTAVVGYAGTLITVYFSAGELGVEIDGIEHAGLTLYRVTAHAALQAGLTLEADDLSETMRESLMRSLRAQFDSEAAAA